MSKTSLSDISRPIEQDLEKFNSLFKESLKSNVGLVDLVTKYILRQKGKKIRPILVLLSSKISGGVTARTFRGATLVELLHTATLVHDDVVDASETRRGLPSINSIWKNKIAVLMGDYLLARGLMLSVDGNDFDFLRITSDTVKRMSEAELLQIRKTRKLDIDEETYFRIIADKTASLLSTCCEIGALASTDDIEKIKALRNFGEALGIAFQIQDDILDFIGKKKIVGKPLGGDIKEKKLTLPIIHSLRMAPKSESAEMLKIIKNNSKKGGIEKVIEFVIKFDGIDYSKKVAEEYSGKAMSNLSIFEDSEARRAMEMLIRFVLERKK